MKNKLSVAYELTDNHFIVKEFKTVKKEIPLSSLKKLTKTKYGYKVEFKSDTLYILDQIENKDELWEILNKKL